MSVVYSFEDRRAMNLPEYVKIGRGTYFADATRWQRFQEDESIRIGNFCSIALNVQFVCGGCHRTDLVSTFPFDPHRTYDFVRSRSIVVENDVWIGEGVYIGGGAVVGNGAVLGANAIVYGRVPPYAIMTGNPAKIHRYRFNRKTIQDLLEIAWWNWPSERIKENEEWFYKPVESFIEKFKGS